MNDILVPIAIYIGFFALDWLITTRVAAFYTGFDYHYKFSPLRLVLAIAICAYLVFFYEKNDVNHPSMPRLFVAAASFFIYAAVVVRDVRAQKTG